MKALRRMRIAWLAAVAAVVLIGVSHAHGERGSVVGTTAAQDAVFMCPMHPDVRGSAGDRCPVCGMNLVPAAGDYTPYLLDIAVAPRAIQPKRRARVEFLVRNPRTGAVVQRFESVHERLFHLFVVSRTLDYFAHVHPALRSSGALDVDITVPRAGAYDLIADFVPEGGAPQLVQRAVVTAGFPGPLTRAATPAPDLSDKIDGSIRVHLTAPDPRARREQLLTFELFDAATGAPVRDVEPYLGANGHLLVVSSDFASVFHSHPVAEVSSPRGPTVVFQALFPAAGTYRMWAQFQRAGRISTVPFTVAIEDSGFDSARGFIG
jgi:hypothetical protein